MRHRFCDSHVVVKKVRWPPAFLSLLRSSGAILSSPLIDEESLKTPERLDSFLEQVVANAGWKTLSEGKNHTPRSLALFHKAYTPGWGEERGEAIDKLQKIVRLAEADDTNFAHTTLRYRTLYTETVRRLPLSLERASGLRWSGPLLSLQIRQKGTLLRLYRLTKKERLYYLRPLLFLLRRFFLAWEKLLISGVQENIVYNAVVGNYFTRHGRAFCHHHRWR